MAQSDVIDNKCGSFRNMRAMVAKIITCLCFHVFIVACIPNYASADSALESNALKRIHDAVFEVVVPKPTKDSLTYEHPLPLHLIPYAIRTDKYYSIGTAFAIGPKELVTAAHVMNVESESQFKEVYVRDRDGNVYAIDKITKYSNQRDFVVFCLKDKTAGESLQVNTAPEINQKVFAVGNALGEGIVIRDGLYTSSTPEAEEGAWKWIRFSAPASPGNSGGPLLDTDGKVIGIVLQKSPNENLNIALPIAEVLNAKENLATAHMDIKYYLMNIRSSSFRTFHKEIILPKSYQELNRELIESLAFFTFNMTKSLFKEKKNTIFPNGKGSDIILNSDYNMTFPNLIMQSEDGNWYASYPREIKEATLPHNGRLQYGAIDNFLFLYIQKPDDMSLDAFYNNRKQPMDLLLKGVMQTREVGPESSRITSMGDAVESYTFTDSYGRKWFVKTWLMEYCDQKAATFSLPIPGGCITMMVIGQTGLVNFGYIPDLKILTNFIYLSYYGTLKNWREFLQMKEFLPLALSENKISFDFSKSFSYRSKRIFFSPDPGLMNLSENSVVKLSFNYFRENGETVWDVSKVTVGEHPNDGSYVSIDRRRQPEKELGEKFQTEWETVAAAKFPFNKAAFPNNKLTSIATVLKRPDNRSAPVLYTATYGQEGKAEQVEMEKKLEELLRDLTIYEYGPGKDISHSSRNNSYHDKSEYFEALWDEISGMPQKTAESYALRANVYGEKGDTRQAIENYDKAIAVDPTNADLYFGRALTNQSIGKSDLALADYNKAVELNPMHAAAYCNRGKIYEDRGNLSDALSNYNKAIEKNPRLAEAYFARGNISGFRNEVDQAIADYSKAIECNPNYAAAYVNRGNRWMGKGEKSKALADYDKALEIDPMLAEAYNARGNAYSTMGALQSALNDLNKALDINPLYAEAYMNRGITYGRKKEYDLSLSDFNKSLELNPKNALAYSNRGFTYKIKGDLTMALADFDRAISLNPKEALAYINRGYTYAQKKDMVNACSDWKKACENGICASYIKAKNMGDCE